MPVKCGFPFSGFSGREKPEKTYDSLSPLRGEQSFETLPFDSLDDIARRPWWVLKRT
jgi:hypothetical protein